MNVDKRPVIFIILATLTILVGTLLTTFIPLFLGTTTASIEKVIPYKPLEIEGRDIYIREGCNNCHTQTVRPLPFETARYGAPSKLEESAIDRPHPGVRNVRGRTWHVSARNIPQPGIICT